MLLALKDIHIFCAYTAGIGIVIRGVLVIAQNTFGKHRITKILPHVIDTVLLLSGLVMAYQLSYIPSEQPWLLAKLIALGFYILFGLILMRWAKTTYTRVFSLIAVMSTFVYIVGAAHTKSVSSILYL